MENDIPKLWQFELVKLDVLGFLAFTFGSGKLVSRFVDLAVGYDEPTICGNFICFFFVAKL